MTTALIQHHSSLLRNTLLANAAFSAISGLSFILFARTFSNFLGWSNIWILPAIGIGLLGFAFIVYQSAKSPRLSSSRISSILTADIAWVILSVFILITNIVPLTLEGKWAVGILADIVAIFALLEYLGLRRIKN